MSSSCVQANFLCRRHFVHNRIGAGEACAALRPVVSRFPHMDHSRQEPHEQFWTLPLLMACLAVAIRLAVIVAFPASRDDLRIYTYFGRMMAEGLNPYLPPLDGPIAPSYANIAPFNLGVFATILSLWNSPTALRIAFALVDGLIVLTVGYGVRRSRAWRTSVMDFYTFNPLVIMALVVDAQDKVVVLWMTIMVLVSIEASKGPSSLVWTTLLALYRWLGVFFVLPVALYFARSWRSLVLSLALFGCAIALSHVAYWPENLFIYESRAARTLINPPIHDSPTMLLADLGIYGPRFVPSFILAALTLLYALFAMRKVSLVEVVVLSTFFTTMASPELPMSRIVMVSIPIFWLIRLTRRRVLWLWAVTIVAAPFVHPDIATNMLNTLGLQAEIAFPSTGHMLLMNLFAAILLGFYALDKLHGRVPRTTMLPESRWLVRSTPREDHQEQPLEVPQRP